MVKIDRTYNFIRSIFFNTHGSFRGCWLRIHHQIFKIQDRGSNMADENPKSLGIIWKSVFSGFWGRWLRIHHQIFKIQDGRPNMADENPKSLGIGWKSVYWEKVADYESIIRFSKFKIDQAPRTVRGKGTHYNQAPQTVKGKGTHNNQAPRKRQNSAKSTSLSPGYAKSRIIFEQKMWKLDSHPRILKIWW